MSTLPLFSYPSTILLTDDDPVFLEAMALILKKNYAVSTFTTPHPAIDFLKNQTSKLSSLKLLRGCTDLENYDVSGHLPVDIHLNPLKKLRLSDTSADEISVIIVDYNMPEMNGIDFCRQLKSLPVKKILLTGEVSDRHAIQALNEGVIDCYVRKDSASLADDIQFYLKMLTQEYFSYHSKHLLTHLETDHHLPISDPTFIEFFKEWCRTHNIQKYFIIDQYANFVLLDQHNRELFFVTHTERTLNDFIELHEDNDEVRDYVEAVRAREKIPFFGEDNESWRVEVGQWDKHFYVPRVLEGREKYYWVVVEKT